MPAPLRIAVTGSTGLIGRALVEHLRSQGHRVHRLLRPASKADRHEDDIAWDPERGSIALQDLEGIDAAINLAGEGIADQAWTAERKRLLVESRVKTTSLLSRSLTSLKNPPRVLVSASGVGAYGDRGDEPLDETSAVPGASGGFLAETTSAWEGATSALTGSPIRRVLTRIGLVLAPDGGALARMVGPFRWGLGGRLGSGQQWMSWIVLDDLVAALVRAVEDERLSGPVNLVSPNPVRNGEFTKTLANVLERPAVMPLPEVVVRTFFGQMGQEALLFGQRVLPKALEGVGFEFAYPELEGGLRHVLSRRRT